MNTFTLHLNYLMNPVVKLLKKKYVILILVNIYFFGFYHMQASVLDIALQQ